MDYEIKVLIKGVTNLIAILFSFQVKGITQICTAIAKNSFEGVSEVSRGRHFSFKWGESYSRVLILRLKMARFHA